MGDAWIASIKARVDFLNSVLAQKNISAVFVLSALAIVNVAIIVVIDLPSFTARLGNLGEIDLNSCATLARMLQHQEPTAKRLNYCQLK